MSRTIQSITDIVERQLCSGCGACAYMEPERFRMRDALDYGRRPYVLDGAPVETGEAAGICPGVGLEHSFDRRDPALVHELTDAWGPVYAVWEGYAADDEIRRAGSSGGAASALALYCIEKGGMAGVLHTAARKDIAYLNETVMSTTREQRLAVHPRKPRRRRPAHPLERIRDRIGSRRRPPARVPASPAPKFQRLKSSRILSADPWRPPYLVKAHGITFHKK